MSKTPKHEKQKKFLLKIVDKLYKKDLEEILGIFFASKKGSKHVLKSKVIEFIETDKQDIDFNKLNKEIKRVYKSNPKIKRSPKKAKSSVKKKSANKVKPTAERVKELEDLRRKLLNDCIKTPDEDESSNGSAHSTDTEESPSSTEHERIILRLPIPTPNERPQTVNFNDNYETLSNNPNERFESTASSSNPSPNITNYFELYARKFVSGQPYAQQLQSTSSINTNMLYPVPPPALPPPPTLSAVDMLTNSFNIYRNNNINPSQGSNAYPLNGEVVGPPVPPNITPNSVPNNQLIRPLTNPYNVSAQPINYSINNYFQSSTAPQNFTFHQNFFQNPVSDVLNPQTFDSFIEQQKFLLSQYPKSFQENDKNSRDSDVPLNDFVFKTLPKFKTFKVLKETKTIGSLTDIGIEVKFDVNPTDLEPNYFEEHMRDSLKTLLERKALKVQLRFTYVSDVNSREHKDSLPEYLCIEFNNQRIFTYEEDCENMTGPFDLSEYSDYYENKVRFYVNKANYTFLLPCIYEISIVSFETCDAFLSKLKQNMFQFLSSESTKQLIRSRSDQLSQDEIISINTDTKLKLICPLSRRRIETPCRTSECKHIECFDAYSFFKTNESRYDWFCPICQKSAQFDKLRIDGYIAEVLNSTEDSITEIVIKPDSSYDVMQKIKTEKETVVIELDDSISDDDIECSVIDADGCIVLD